jgi:hypothetical protein
VKAWTDLYKEHQAIRRSAGKFWSTEVRKRLNTLMHHCGATPPRPFTKKANGRLEEWFIPGGALELTNLVGGGSAKLDVLVRSDSGTGHIHGMNVFVEGIRDDDSKWVIAVHLPDDRRLPDGDKQGFGACSHAALHCHVGPTLDDEPKVRVPMPALSLPEVLDWLIAQVTQSETFEPAPWADPRVAAACMPDAKSR